MHGLLFRVKLNLNNRLLPGFPPAQERHMQPPSSFKVAKAWFLFLACALLPFFWGLAFLYPRGDDFDYAARAMFFLDVPGGILESVREWLFQSGSYTYHFLAVLLGKGGIWPLLSALVCAAVLAVHVLAGYVLARALGGSRSWAALWGGFALFCLLACHQGLYLFYRQTGALSVGLQSGAGLLFAALLCRLWRAHPAEAVPRSGVRHGALRTQQGLRGFWRRCAAPTVWAAAPRRYAVLAGILAIGVYEQAALAVCLAAAVAALLAWRCRHPLARDFTRVIAWMLVALVLSFLAPGNIVSRAVRHVDTAVLWQNLASLPADWLHTAFWCFSFPWLLAVTALTLLLPRPAREEREKIPSPYPWLCLAAPLVYVLFTLSVALLHAGTSASITAAPRYAAGMAPYGAFVLGVALYPFVGWLVRRLQGMAHARDMRLWLILLPAVLLLCGNGNWRLTAVNACNGAFADIADRLSLRYACLEAEGRVTMADEPAFRFGLLGELTRPARSENAVDARLPGMAVRRLDYGVFPVHMEESLPQESVVWPNLRVAWLYGLGSVRSASGNAAAAGAAALQPSARPLFLSPQLEELGIRSAWLAGTQGENITFAEIWLVLRCSAPLPETWCIWRQSPVDMRRLPPLPLQRWWGMKAEELARRQTALPGWLADMAGVRLNVRPAQWRIPSPEQGTDIFYAFPLIPRSPLADVVPPVRLWAETPQGLMPFGESAGN